MIIQQTIRQTFYAWAINTNYVDIDGSKHPGFIGRYWWGPKVPINLEGCRVSLFKTRKEAKAVLSEVRETFPKASISKVEVTINEVGK